jgi:3-dehydroquinate synthase
MKSGSAATVRVELPREARGRGYTITIGPHAIERLPEAIRSLSPSRLHVVTDRNVWRAWGGRLRSVLRGGDFGLTVLPPGERSKSVASAVRIWRDLVRAGCDRRSCVLAFGGGVVGDLAGFAAASFLRGIDFIQVPTTLLAMVDSSVGGKTGIDLPEGKNLVGAFHQPRAVLADIDLLSTLPARQARAGWAEVIKTAAIGDSRLFGVLEEESAWLLAGDAAAIGRAVLACCRVKASVVARDERESGLRRILNFGHTLAHGIEAAAGYRTLHGEAVAAGMAFAAGLGEALGVTLPGATARLLAPIEAFGLRPRPARLSSSRVLAAMEHDKKRGARGLRWVLVREIGRAVVRDDIPWTVSRKAVVWFLAGARA